MRRLKMYIAGKVTGTNEVDCAVKFHIAEQQWKLEGYDVLNPLQLVKDFSTPWDQAMRICLKAVCEADEAYFLDDWQDSKGARLEHQIATELKMKIHYE